ncbi:MAG: outer membrane beta-barrel protein [Cellulophaga sp.]
MKSQFDKNLAKKIKKELLNHTEQYEEGAWEYFLSKKKKKKRKVFYWCLTGVASSVVLIINFSLFFLKEDISIPIKNNERILDKVIPSSKTPSLENILKDIQKVQETEQIKKNPVAITNNPIENKESSKNNITLDALPYDSISKTKLANIVPKENQVLDSAIVFHNKKNQSLVVTDSISEDKLDLLAIANELEENDDDESELKEKQSSKFQIGLSVSPSFGTDKSNSRSMASSNIGAGVSMDIPINSSNFSINTGVIFNILNTSNNNLRVFAEGELENETTDFETNQLNIDIPLNVVYTISNNKKNLFVMAGISSYVTLSENQEIETTTTHEIEVIREIGGVIEVTTVTESVVSKESFKEKTGKFIPLGAINISFGYRAKLTNRLKYEIQPFYKYPLKSLTTNDFKVPTAGIVLKLIFSE